MAKEIERKFLVDKNIWNNVGKPFEMIQAYLMIEGDKVIRVRIKEDKAYITIKGNLQGITRDEFEYEIPVDDAKKIMQMRIGAIIAKTRYISEIGGKIWEVDVFKGENEGLIVAEIELESEDEEFKRPEWILDEVSTDVRYYNFNLTKNPFSRW